MKIDSLLSLTFGFYSEEITETESFSFIANLKINFFIPLQGNLQNITTKVVVFRIWFICLLVVGVMFASSFVSSLVGGLCLLLGLSFVGWWLCDNIISFNSRDGVSVGLFYYRFKAIPWILNYKWADYWPYWEYIYLFLYVAFCCCVYYHGLFVSCLGCCWCWAFFNFFYFVISICTKLLCFGRGI